MHFKKLTNREILELDITGSNPKFTSEGIIPSDNIYILEKDTDNEFIPNWGKKVYEFIQKEGFKARWSKAPKVRPNDKYHLWYYEVIHKDNINLENYKINPDGIKPKQDGEDNSLLVQKDYADKYATTTLSIEKITEKLKPIREEVLSYYNQTIRFDKRKSSYQFKSFPKVWRRQTDGINKILSQRETVITIPVGGGKSLITIEAFGWF